MLKSYLRNVKTIIISPDEHRAKNWQVMGLGSNLSKILVAIDGSEHSDYALNVSVKIGEKFSSTMDLVHVELPSSEAGPEPSIKKPDKIFDDRVEMVKERKLICNPIKIQSSDPADEILKLVNSGSYDLAVLEQRSWRIEEPGIGQRV